MLKNQKAARLRDGRKLTWWESGLATGKPIVFCTGAGMSGRLGVDPELIARKGLRWMAFNRPGLGNSDPDPNKDLSSWCLDVDEVFRNEGLSRSSVSLVGFSQGAPFALALAHTGFGSAVAIVSGQDDFSDDETRALLPAPVRSFVEAVQCKDSVTLNHLTETADPDGFLQLILSLSSDRDRDFYSSEPFRSNYLESLREGFRQGPQGYVHDLVTVMNPWPMDLSQIKSRVHLWYGALDGNFTHSPDGGLRLAQKLPNCKRHFLSNEGGSLLWTRTDEILRALEA